MLSQEATQELKEIMHRDYGVSISDNQAELLGDKVIRLALLARRSMLRRLSSTGQTLDSEMARGRQRVPDITKPAQERGVLLPPETSVDADQNHPGAARA